MNGHFYFFVISLSCSILSLNGCSSSGSSLDSMAFDNVRYIEEFPESFTLSNPDLVDLGLLGVNGLSVQDSLLIVSHRAEDGFWSFFNLSDYSPLGAFIKKGRGNNEFLSVPRVSQQFFFNIDCNLYALIYNSDLGRIVRMDVTKSLREGVGSITDICAGVEKHMYRVAPLDTNIYFCRKANQSMMSQDRYLLAQGERVVTQGMEVLNQAKVKRSTDVNLLNSFVAYSSINQLIAEASLHLNTINVYSIDDESDPITFCYGRKMTHLSELNWPNNSSYDYVHITEYDYFFAALYQGYDFDIYEFVGKTPHPRIQFFGWDPCEPLAEIVLDRDATSFDIDFRSGKLYTVSYNTEEICVYDIKDVLEYLPN